MKNLDVIKAFFCKQTAKTANLRSEVAYDNTFRLINYNTTLAQLNPYGTLIINETKYRVSTSKIQNLIRKQLQGKYISVDNINYGIYNLK